METPITFYPKISRAIRDGDCELLEKLIAGDLAQLNVRTPFAGGTWLHYAASEGNLRVVETLVKMGFDVNKPGYQEGDLPLDCAACNGHLEIARYLLDQGSRMNTSTSVGNPLFGAVIGKSPAVARLLLERGINAPVRYNSNTMNDMDATAFALMRGEAEIARVIALHNASGDITQTEALLVEAKVIASKQAPLRSTRIIPADEDLSGGDGRPN